MAGNPYATPETHTLAAVEVKLASAKQILTAGLLGGPIAGFWLLVMNYRASGRTGALALAALAGLVIAAGLLLASMKAPTDVPDWLFWLLTVAVLGGWLKFGPPFFDEADIDQQARVLVNSGWGRTIGVVLVTLVWMVPLLFAVSMLAPIQPVNTYKSGNNLFHFEGYATRADAVALDNALREQGVYSRLDALEVTLRFPKSKPGLVEIDIASGFLDDATARQVANAFRPVVKSLKEELYKPRTVRLDIIGPLGNALASTSS